jgi:signal transduction histidine kinase
MDDGQPARLRVFTGVLSSIAHELVGKLAVAQTRVANGLAMQQLTEILDELKTLGRLGGGIRDIPVDLDSIIRDVVAEARRQPKWRSVKIIGDDGSLGRIKGDSELIARALRVLVENAADSCTAGRGGTVTVRGEDVDNGVKLVVQQTAPLPSGRELARLLAPSFSSTKRLSGFGIGIPTAIAVAAAHDGTLAGDPEEKSFLLWLPR